MSSIFYGRRFAIAKYMTVAGKIQLSFYYANDDEKTGDELENKKEDVNPMKKNRHTEETEKDSKNSIIISFSGEGLKQKDIVLVVLIGGSCKNCIKKLRNFNILKKAEENSQKEKQIPWLHTIIDGVINMNERQQIIFYGTGNINLLTIPVLLGTWSTFG